MSRAARILAMLEDARYVAVDELAEALGVSRRTVAAEVNALQDLVGASASIGLDDGRYRLLIADPARYREARAVVESTSFNDPATRASYIVARLFRALAPVRIEELGAAMSVSRTTVVADLERARAQVAEACVLHFTGVAVPVGGVDELRRPGIVASVLANAVH